MNTMLSLGLARLSPLRLSGLASLAWSLRPACYLRHKLSRQSEPTVSVFSVGSLHGRSGVGAEAELRRLHARCLSLEASLSTVLGPFALTTAGVPTAGDLERLTTVCLSSDFSCPSSHCRILELTRSSDGTTSFIDPAGGATLPFLTWNAVLESQRLGRGFTGGLKSGADVEHVTWACVVPSNCSSSLIGEFHFWGWNSALSVIAPLNEVSLSFCSLNSSGAHTLLVKNSFTDVYDLTPSLQQADPLLNIFLWALDPTGCRSFQARGNTDILVRLQISGFYPYSRTHYTGRDGSFIFAGLVPLQQAPTLVISEAACDLLRPHAPAALEWGSKPSNLDLFVSLPVLDSDQQLFSCGLRVNGSTTWLDPDSELACRSAGGSWIQRQMPKGSSALALSSEDVKLVASASGIIRLQRSDASPFGVALPPGVYRVYATVREAEGTFAVETGRATVAAYWGNATEAKERVTVSSRTVNGLRGRWWHALNVIAKQQQARSCLQIQRVDALVGGDASAPYATPPALEMQEAKDVMCSS
ncbi:hypothetical protein GUITHDRAFT_137440 [Guillardia theta CCMP2712]|uniref:Uncharacterized protein n=1 Tax=Guillardia theta (strain CCMP2712) TaxID=905079 RepID=L1JHS3_GUITC|nr:hypothetical protein GUITHDRAFT_137440 [Guillardia theta CCMP2712]EKX47694.1 hypothetical protein GUITHDRAFT_137440 [Guillardia theta CCMP2712]|eukprot:XP_005834674.1 hypothetical protein GUITHDRAFT_137440 [Guillardia theta CCMP2712]